MPISEQMKWGLGPTAPAGSRGRAPGLYFPNRTLNFLLLELRFPYLRAYGAEPLALSFRDNRAKRVGKTVRISRPSRRHILAVRHHEGRCRIIRRIAHRAA